MAKHFEGYKIRCKYCKNFFLPDKIHASIQLCTRCKNKTGTNIEESKLREDCDEAYKEGAILE